MHMRAQLSASGAPCQNMPDTPKNRMSGTLMMLFVAGLHHAAHSAGRHCRSGSWLRDVCDRALSGEEHSGN